MLGFAARSQTKRAVAANRFLPPSPRARAIAAAIILLSLDVLLILADLLRHAGLLRDVRFAVTAERSYGEWFEYVKAIIVALLLFGAARRTRAALVWGGLFVYLALDDAFAVHEALGVIVARGLSLPAVKSIEPRQLGELVIYGVVGLAFTIALVSVLRRSDGASRLLTAALALPFALLVFFGAGMDVIHSLLSDRTSRDIVGLIEDGGEMIAMSLLVAITWWATRTGGDGL